MQVVVSIDSQYIVHGHSVSLFKRSLYTSSVCMWPTRWLWWWKWWTQLQYVTFPSLRSLLRDDGGIVFSSVRLW